MQGAAWEGAGASAAHGRKSNKIEVSKGKKRKERKGKRESKRRRAKGKMGKEKTGDKEKGRENIFGSKKIKNVRKSFNFSSRI